MAGYRAGCILLLASLLQACGGGDSDEGGGSSGRIQVSPSTLEVSAEPGDFGPTGGVQIRVSDRPSGQLYLGARYSTTTIQSLDFISSSTGVGTLNVYFKPPHLVPDGINESTIEFHICRDEACTQDIAGSPVDIPTAYDVSGGVTASLSRDSIDEWTSSLEATAREERLLVTLDRPPEATGFVVVPEFTSNVVMSVTTELGTDVDTTVVVQLRPGAALRPGTYDDTVTLNICYDPGCIQQLEGAPFTLPTRLVVDVGAEPGFQPLEVLSRVALAHDVVDAEFSKALNAVVMVGTYPANALYVHDVTTGIETQQALAATPTTVAVSPDGLTAAAGHAGSISVVDLATVGQPGAPAPTVLDVSIDAFDLFVDGRGRAHVLPPDTGWGAIHTVDIDSGVEAESTGAELYGGSRGQLHPSGDYLYTAQFDEIQKWNVTADHATWQYESPPLDQHAICETLWFKEDGAAIYTACGNAFRSSAVQADDMTYLGTLELTDPDFGFRIRSLSHSAARNEIALIEYDWDLCERSPSVLQCFTHLATYDGDTLAREAVHSIPAIRVGDADYAQHGQFIFHGTNGTRKYLVSRLAKMTDPDAEFYLSVIE